MYNTNLNVSIIEDNMQSQEYLKGLLHNHFPEIKINGCAGSVVEGVKLLKKKSNSLVFMDIELLDGTSFDILKQFPQPDFEIVFITAYEKFYELAFQHFAFNYLKKPFQLNDIKQVIDKYYNLKDRIIDRFRVQNLHSFIQEKDPKLLIQIGFNYENIRLDTILKAEAYGNFTKIFCTDESVYHASNSLKYYDSLLKYKGFIRINRFSIVNVKHIKTIKRKETVILSNGDKVSISNRYRQNIELLLNTFS